MQNNRATYKNIIHTWMASLKSSFSMLGVDTVSSWYRPSSSLKIVVRIRAGSVSSFSSIYTIESLY